MLQWSYFEEDVEQDVQTYKSDLVVSPDAAFAILWLKRGRELVLKRTCIEDSAIKEKVICQRCEDCRR